MQGVEKSTSAKPLTDDEVGDELIRHILLQWLRNAVEVIHDEVPMEAWPRVAARLEAAGVLPPIPDQRERG